MESPAEEKTANQAEAGMTSHSADGALVIVEFAPTTSSEAKEWLTALIRAPVTSGGAGLEARLVPNMLKGCDSLHLSAQPKRFLTGAEKLKIKKQHKVTRGPVEFSVSHAQQFEDFSEDNAEFLTTAEKQRIIMNALDNVKSYKEQTVPGHPKVRLFSGRSIFPVCISNAVITQVYPLHEDSKLKALEHKWYLRLGQKQPLDDIREYFGETIGMYFGFLGFYSLSLLPPVLLVVVFRLSGAQEQTKNTVFAILNLVWATAFLEFWKRRCSEMSFKWGTIKSGIGTDEVEEPRPGYWGHKRISPITGELSYYYPPWKRKVKMYAVSYPLVLVCMWLATGVVLVYFQFLHYVEAKYTKASGIIASVMLALPSVLYAIVIAVLNNLYHRLATFLTEWENHRLESAYNNHLIVKLVLFYFVNCFYSLFYIAFYLQDIELLRTHLGALMITSQLIGQVTESLIPYMMFRSRVTKVAKEGKKIVVKSADLSDSAERQSSQELYPGTFADYLELFLQFGYTFLFSSAYPMAAFWALLNNVIELRTDAFKMCRIYQRPFSQPAHSIGAWEVAFQSMGVIAVITNCALVGMAAKSAHWLPDMTPFNALLMFVVIEHVLLSVKFFLAVAIPDVPQWVQDEMARQDFHSRLALKAQASLQAEKPTGRKETRL